MTCRFNRPARVPEKAVQSHIVQLLRSAGAKVYVMGTRRRRGDFQGTMQTEGIPDLMAFLPIRTVGGESLPLLPRLLFVECKAAGGRLRPEQREFQERCREANVAHVVGDLDVVIAWLAERGYVKPESFPHYRQPNREIR